jgi:hypothetical protein
MERRQINEEELQYLYNLIGEAIWHSQHVEQALHTFVTLKKDIKVRGSVSPEAGEELFKKNQRRTLGFSLKASSEAAVLSASLQKRVEAFKEERNWLIHWSLPSNGADLYLDTTRFALMERVKRLTVEARAIHGLIAEELEVFVCSQGVSKKWIMETALETIRKLKGERN